MVPRTVDLLDPGGCLHQPGRDLGEYLERLADAHRWDKEHREKRISDGGVDDTPILRWEAVAQKKRSIPGTAADLGLQLAPPPVRYHSDIRDKHGYATPSLFRLYPLTAGELHYLEPSVTIEIGMD